MVGSVALLALGVVAQQPRITTTIRPERVRVGQEAVLTVLVRTVGGTVDHVEFLPPQGIRIVNVRGSRSTYVSDEGGRGRVFRREFRLRPLEPGSYALSGPRVMVDGRLAEGSGVALSVSPGGSGAGRGARARDRPDDDRIAAPAPEDIPAEPGGRLEERGLPRGEGPGYPWSWQWYGPGPGALPGCGPTPEYLPFGTPYRTPRIDPAPGVGPGPIGGGSWCRPLLDPYVSPWRPPAAAPGPGAGTYGPQSGGKSRPPLAEGDPWWSEVVPEFRDFVQVVEDPAGLLRLGVAIAPRDRVYEGQQLTLLTEVDVRPEALLRLESDPRLVASDAERARVVDIPGTSPGVAAARAGRVERAFTFRRAFFALSPGRLVLSPTRVLYAPDRRTGAATAGVLDTLSSDPLAVSVLPVPVERAPPGYAGAVGRLRMELDVDRTRLSAGESALLTVAVTGAGYLPAVPSPRIEADPLAGLRPLAEESFLRVKDGVVGGTKIFRWLVVPREAGTLRIGPAILPHFDPWIGDFGVVATGEVTLDVEELPGETGSGPTVEGTGEPPTYPGRGEVPMSGAPDGRDGGAGRRDVREWATGSVTEADSGAGFGAARDVDRGSLPDVQADRTTVAGGGPGVPPLPDSYRFHGAGAVLSLFLLIAPAVIAGGRAALAFHRGDAPLSAALSRAGLLLVGALTVSGALEAMDAGPVRRDRAESARHDSLYRAGLRALEDGRPLEASLFFREYADARPDRPEGWIATAVAASRGGRPGVSRWALLRARRVAPRHPIPERMAEAGDRLAGELLPEPSWLSPPRLRMVVASAWLLLAGGLAGAPLPGSRRWAAGLAFLTLGLSALPVLDQRRWHRLGVVVTDSTALLSSPVASARPISRLGGGRTLRMDGSRGSWLRVRIPDSEEGWIPAHAVRGMDGDKPP